MIESYSVGSCPHSIKYIKIINNSMEEIPLEVDFLKNLSLDNINLRPHSINKMFDRDIKDEWIHDCLLNQKLMGILKQRPQRFRLYYNHPEKSQKYDLIIVIDVSSSISKYINVVTTYEQEVDRRVR
jgi:hypothetical protein